ncbi:MAG: hypothetical protein M1832_000164 [Thelocarpon impressellum]|nr:MAG: hypothetical protein M1832_000164 [Thelocarpon impressellum]
MAQPNLILLATDNDTATLLPLLRAEPALASHQDVHGYSLVHAAVSYGHKALLRTLVADLHADVNIADADGETPLFQAESVDVARVLVEELGADVSIRNGDGLTAAENIARDGDWPLVAAYLREVGEGPTTHSDGAPDGAVGREGTASEATSGPPPPLPPDVSINVGTMEEPSEAAGAVDPAFRRRIEELAAREDFQGEEGQQELRSLITEVVRGHVVGGDAGPREVRRRVE